MTALSKGERTMTIDEESRTRTELRTALEHAQRQARLEVESRMNEMVGEADCRVGHSPASSTTTDPKVVHDRAWPGHPRDQRRHVVDGRAKPGHERV